MDISNSTMTCIKGFDANEDISGIGMVISLYIMGGWDMSLCAIPWFLRYVHPREASKVSQQGKRWVDWVDRTSNSIARTSLASGYAIMIAAITQREKISHYHTYFVFLLADAVNPTLGTGPYGVTSKDRYVQVLTIYYVGYQVLWAIKMVMAIQRLDDWKDEPGKCFITFPGGNGDLAEKEDAIIWMQISLALQILFQFIVPLGKWTGLFEIWRPQSKAARGTLALHFLHLPGLYGYIWDVRWVFKRELIKANQHLIDKSTSGEAGWSFGQVGAVVALVGCLHEVVSSHIKFKAKRQRSKATAIDETERVGLLSSQHEDFMDTEEMAMGSTSAPRLPEQRRTFSQ